MTLRILHVEDDPDDAAIFERAVASSGRPYAIAHASTLVEARQMLEQGQFDLGVVDYALPDGTGLDLMREVSEHNPDLPVVILTGHGDERLAVQALKGRAADYILKDDLLQPATMDSLVRAVEVRRAERQRESSTRILVDQDEVTGLLRRGKILVTLDTLLGQQLPVTAAILDIDNAALIEETFGRDFCSFAMRKIASIARRVPHPVVWTKRIDT